MLLDCGAPLVSRKTIELIRKLNEANIVGEDEEFSARISAYDTAFKMQTEAPEVFDISKESEETRKLYGVGGTATDEYPDSERSDLRAVIDWLATQPWSSPC